MGLEKWRNTKNMTGIDMRNFIGAEAAKRGYEHRPGTMLGGHEIGYNPHDRPFKLM